MAEVAGVVRFGGGSHPDNAARDGRIGLALSKTRGRVFSLSETGATFFAHGQTNTQPLHRLRGQIFAAIARLDNRDDLRVALSAEPTVTDEALLWLLFRQGGAAGIARAEGVFAFAHWDGGRLTLGRDCVKGCPIFFHVGDGFVAFATDIGTLFAHPQVPYALDEEMLAHNLVVNWFTPQGTLYRGVDRVPNCHLATIDPDGVRLERYWAPNLARPDHLRSFDDFVEQGREVLDRSVKSALSHHDHLCIALSGGLDSSAVAATAARLFPHRSFPCYTVVAPPGCTPIVGRNLYWDEESKVRELGRLYPNLRLNFIEAQPESSERDYFEHFTRNRVSGGLMASLPFAELVHRSLADGYKIQVNGNGGNWGLSWDGDYALVALLRDGLVGQFLRELVAQAGAERRSMARTFVSRVLLKSGSRRLRDALLRCKGENPGNVSHVALINPEFVADLGLMERWREQGFDQWYLFGTWRPERLRAKKLFDAAAPFIHNRNLLAGAQYDAYLEPLSDRRLLEFSLQVPEYFYCRNGVRRSFARAVLADRLPPEIVNERRFGAQDVGRFHRFAAQRAQIGEEIARIEASPTARRLIDIPRLKRLYQNWPTEEPTDTRRASEYRDLLPRALDAGRLIRFVERGNG